MAKKIDLPLTREKAMSLKAGDKVYLSGTVYTARDAAHALLIESLDKKEKLPFDLQDAVIYYVGPAPRAPSQVIGSAGPTTSYRMDSFTPRLIEEGLRGMIGKGQRSKEVVQAMTKHKAVYFAAIGGAGALLAQRVKSVEIIAYDYLGAEAVRKLEVKDLPVTVVIDTKGQNIYEAGPAAFLKAKGQKEK